MKKSALIVGLLLLAASTVFAAAEGSGRKNVTTAGTPVALSSTEQQFSQLTICADPDNTGQIAVGTTPIASTSVPQGIFLLATECYTIERRNGNIAEVKVDSTVSGEGCSYEFQYL